MLNILKYQTALGTFLNFLLKKKSRASIIVTDLRIHKVIQPMVPLQSGIPLSYLLPEG